MDRTAVAKELVRLAKELTAGTDGFEGNYIVSLDEYDREVKKFAVSAGGKVVSEMGMNAGIFVRLPYWEKGHERGHGIDLMFLYKHYETGKVSFQVWSAFENKRDNIHQEFSTWRGDDELKAFKRFQRYLKTRLPVRIDQLLAFGVLVPMN